MDFFSAIALWIIPFLLVLGVVVTVHELGHFLAARALGTKVDRFSIGFGKALATWRDKAGVEWRLGWAPIGGYVRFAGDDNAASIPDADDLAAMRREVVNREGEAALSTYFHFKPLWQRALIVAAGPAQTRLSLLASAITAPAFAAAMVGANPAKPTIADITHWASAAAASATACAPAAVSMPDPARRARNSGSARSSSITASRGRQRSACSARREALRPAVSAMMSTSTPACSNRSSVETPTEPVEPRTLTLRGRFNAIPTGLRAERPPSPRPRT